MTTLTIDSIKLRCVQALANLPVVSTSVSSKNDSSCSGAHSRGLSMRMQQRRYDWVYLLIVGILCAPALLLPRIVSGTPQKTR